jgi:hypothetical protein
MSFVAGVYGYTFTQPFDLAGLRFEPLYGRYEVASDRGRDTEAFHLTGVLIVPIDLLSGLPTWIEIFFDVEAALTFCEQQRVALSHCVQLRPGENARTILLADGPHEVKDALPMKLEVNDSLSRRLRPTSGVCLQFDAFAPDMRTRFLNLALKKLSDSDFQQVTGFRAAFFRNTEMVKMGEAPIDVTHSLLFTGLELLARKALNPKPRATLSYILREFLEELGFGITEDEAQQIAQCRNALFHRGELVATYRTAIGSVEQAIKITELPNLGTLFADVLLKVLGFDDPQINWNRWRDRMAFLGWHFKEGPERAAG